MTYRFLVMVSLFLLPASTMTASDFRSTGFDWPFKMCEAMPGEEVAALSPFRQPLKKVERLDGPSNYTGCLYELEDREDAPRIKFETLDFQTPADSEESFNAYVRSFKETYEREPDYIAGLGDKAAYFGQAEPGLCDECALYVASGRYFISVIFKGVYEKIPQPAKQQSAVKLLNRLFEREAFLKPKKAKKVMDKLESIGIFGRKA